MKESKFQFSQPYLEEISFREGGDEVESKSVALNNQIGVQVACKKNESKAIVKIVIMIEAGKHGGIFALKIKLASEFVWKNLGDEKLDVLLHQNAPALLLSYARPIIASITNASKFPTYNIPFFDFSEESVNVTKLDREEQRGLEN